MRAGARCSPYSLDPQPRTGDQPGLGFITDPAAPGGLDLRELPGPSPGEHDVVLDVRAFALNRGELSLLEQRTAGWAPGQDVAGVVSGAAADGTGPPVGTRVLGVADGGGWCERVAVPSHRVAPLPDGIAFADAAALPVAGLTALRALRLGGSLLGRRVLVTGASGGVGSIAVQLAVAAGAEVSARVSGERRAESARALGAHHVLTSLGAEDGPFDLALDGTSASSPASRTREAIDALRRREVTGKAVLVRRRIGTAGQRRAPRASPSGGGARAPFASSVLS